MHAVMRRPLAPLVALLLVAAVPASAQPADEDLRFAPGTPARHALIVDLDTGTVLLEKDADTPFAPASLAKLATAEVIADALGAGEITPQTGYRVSEGAWRTGGAPSRTATMFAAVRSEIPVEALLRGLAVQQANDAAIILAEGMAGTESAFALRMNERAAELGMTGSRFVNATGLPQEGQRTTARDMARLAGAVAQAPMVYPLYAEPEFEWNRILQRNRNPLLRADVGATGLATGFTEGEGFSIVGVSERDGRRTAIVLAGLESDAVRSRETVRLLNWSAENFERRTLFEAGQAVASAEVFGGVRGEVPLVLADDLDAFVPGDRADLVKARIRYDGPLEAPVEEGRPVGVVEIVVDGRVAISRELRAGAAVASGTFSDRAANAVRELAFGWVRSL